MVSVLDTSNPRGTQGRLGAAPNSGTSATVDGVRTSPEKHRKSMRACLFVAQLISLRLGYCFRSGGQNEKVLALCGLANLINDSHINIFFGSPIDKEHGQLLRLLAVGSFQ